jgi:hypothetical protein
VLTTPKGRLAEVRLRQLRQFQDVRRAAGGVLFLEINIKYWSRKRRRLSRDAARHPAVVTHPVIAVMPPIPGIDML